MGGVQYLILTEHKYRLFCLVLWDLLCTFRWENFTAMMRVLSPSSVFRGASVLVEMLSLGESLSDYKLGYQLLSSLYYERKEKKNSIDNPLRIWQVWSNHRLSLWVTPGLQSRLFVGFKEQGLEQRISNLRLRERGIRDNWKVTVNLSVKTYNIQVSNSYLAS